MTKRKNDLISEIEFFPIIPKHGVVGYVSFTYQNSFRIMNCAIITRPTGGYRIAYPLKTLSNGRQVQCVYPINKQLSEKIEKILLVNYENFLVTKVKT